MTREEKRENKAEVQLSIMSDLFAELDRAEKKFPAWPDDIIHQVAILGEEAGEALQAAVQYVYEGGSLEHIEEEVIQVGAMVVRFLQHHRGIPFEAYEVTHGQLSMGFEGD